jgi:hypothetical protein
MTEEEKSAVIMRSIHDARAECKDVLATLPIDVRMVLGKWALEWYREATYKGIGQAIVEDAKVLYPNGI